MSLFGSMRKNISMWMKIQGPRTHVFKYMYLALREENVLSMGGCLFFYEKGGGGGGFEGMNDVCRILF